MDLSVERARRLLLASVGPRATGLDATALLDAMRMIQVDPIDRIGTNPDLVAFARTDLPKGAVYDAAGFEHVAKEWCLLPPDAFPAYRDQARRTPTWRHTKAMLGLGEDVLAAVEAELAERGPCTSLELTDHGDLPAAEHPWANRKVGTLALKVLALRCRAVVVGRRRGARVYDLPSRALGAWADAAGPTSFAAWAIPERVRAAGLLSLGAGPWWGVLKEARRDGSVGGLLEAGVLREVGVAGLRGRWLIEPEALERTWEDDGRMRLLGPLDPLLWHRGLVEHLFGFRYVWEIYKPAEKREWGYYVVPLLHRGALVGRLEARVTEGRLTVDRVWREDPAFDEQALEAALDRLAGQLGALR